MSSINRLLASQPMMRPGTRAWMTAPFFPVPPGSEGEAINRQKPGTAVDRQCEISYIHSSLCGVQINRSQHSRPYFAIRHRPFPFQRESIRFSLFTSGLLVGPMKGVATHGTL